ncbi:hypothetical protein KC19_6G080000 [Ceratodon purpureus]|uniref:Uncharacterized protein n=1 Tax=Ceratodon purpureus TaxID=3225 RepID=A0A8T0HEA7_CERPU|nr:hypothetical protein KC19_6G080000 [Ceratodon purpureus]
MITIFRIKHTSLIMLERGSGSGFIPLLKIDTWLCVYLSVFGETRVLGDIIHNCQVPLGGVSATSDRLSDVCVFKTSSSGSDLTINIITGF